MMFWTFIACFISSFICTVIAGYISYQRGEKDGYQRGYELGKAAVRFNQREIEMVAYQKGYESGIKAAKNADPFLDEIEEVCKKHDLSISHEDWNGAFIIEPYKQKDMDHIRAAIRIS